MVPLSDHLPAIIIHHHLPASSHHAAWQKGTANCSSGMNTLASVILLYIYIFFLFFLFLTRKRTLNPHTLPRYESSVPNCASGSLLASLSREMLPGLPNFGLSPWLLSARFALS